MTLKLHFGCGDRFIRLPGWVNVDVRPDLRPDVVEDLRNPVTWACGSVDLIYACHVLEHFRRDETVAVLKRWRALLKPGGVLRLSVPDLRACMLHYIEHGDAHALQSLLVGDGKHPVSHHYWVFDDKLLRSTLADAGFNWYRIKEWDWRTTEHAGVDDHSQAYLPHMKKDTGRLMSLNLKAVNE